VKRLIFIVPVALFAALAYVLFKSLIAPPPQELPSVLVDKPAPHLTLPALDAATQGFGPAELAAGHVTVVNVFASWCVPCRAEATVLPALAHLKGVALYGMVYKDTPEKARAFLAEVGNPFSRIALDESGRAGIEWGVYGVPETFVIDGKGIIRLRHAGPLTPGVIANDILPAVAKARASG
jgi:cytochrome c biogenesis protein CcmG/thiol:disulfide interchange protein DsbE